MTQGTPAMAAIPELNNLPTHTADTTLVDVSYSYNVMYLTKAPSGVDGQCETYKI